MTSYKDFIKLMKSRGYILKHSVVIDESSPIIKTYPIKKLSIGKVLELECPKNTIISACGISHGCNNGYHCNIKFFDDNDEEPFQEFHHSIPLTQNYHVAAELIVTKILQKPPDPNNQDIQELAKYVNPVLKIINSCNRCEYPIWGGIYKLFSPNSINNSQIFLNNSFNLYANEKMIFHVINPDIDITKTKLEMKVDLLELL